MKAKPVKLADGTYTPCDPDSATHIFLAIPGPIPDRVIPVSGQKINWQWNKDVNNPSLSPSILTKRPDGDITHICHSIITNGIVNFCADCNHELAGQSHPLNDVEL